MPQPLTKYPTNLKVGLEQVKRGDLAQAIKSFSEAVKTNPGNPIPIYSIGTVYFVQKQYQKAVQYFEETIQINPNFLKAYKALAQTYDKLENYPKALEYYQKNISFEKDNPQLYCALGDTYFRLGDYQPAINCYRSAIRLDPKQAVYYHNLGTAYNLAQDLAKSVLFYKKAIRLNPKYFSSHFSLGNVYNLLNDQTNALACYRQAYQLEPENPSLYAPYIYQLSYVCDWNEVTRLTPKLEQVTKKATAAKELMSETPFSHIARSDDPKENLRIAKLWSNWIETKVKTFQGSSPFIFSKRLSSDKIRVGYVSNNFRLSTTAQNITGVLEHHDKTKFEIFAYSIGPDDQSEYRRRIEQAVDHFVDITRLSHTQAAQKIYADKIDILVDLKGYTGGSRIFIFAMKPAPIQVSFLGFVGSTGAKFMNYFIADETVVPASLAKYFSEKIIYLPDTYWPTDNKLQIANTKYQRSDLGIVKKEFVFASFNSNYKIDSVIFTAWMTILKNVPHGKLLILKNSDEAENNLKRMAAENKIDPTRLIFIKGIPKAEHLARIRDLADLALDTRIVNGHTTTTDCLWAGVPVITLLGKHFASRVSASMLTAVGLPELITQSLAEYIRIATKISSDSQKLSQLKSKLRSHLSTHPLFNTALYTSNLERAFLKMIQP